MLLVYFRLLANLLRSLYKNCLFGPENSGKTCLVDTHSISCTDIFIVKLVTVDCGFQFFKIISFFDQNMQADKLSNPPQAKRQLIQSEIDGAY